MGLKGVKAMPDLLFCLFCCILLIVKIKIILKNKKICSRKRNLYNSPFFHLNAYFRPDERFMWKNQSVLMKHRQV